MRVKIKVPDLLKFIILYSIAVSLGRFLFKLPKSLFYVNDLILTIAVVVCGAYFWRKKKIVVPKYVTLISIFLLLTTIIGYIINRYNPLYYLWGARNNFRSVLYFFCCCLCLSRENVEEICDFLIKLLPLNMVLCTLQYVMVLVSGDSEAIKFAGDYVGGMFGNELGCNRLLNVYIIFIFAWVMAAYLKQEKSGIYFLSVFVCCGYMAVLAELKIVLVEMAVLVPVLVQLIKKSANKIVYFALMLIIVMAFANIWGMVNSSFRDMLASLERIVNYASSSSYGQDSVNRLTVIPKVYDLFMEGNVIRMLFGIGLGNADTSNIAFLSTPTFARYGYYRYNLFQSGFLFLEIGLIGLLLYILFFGASFISFLIYQKNTENPDSLVYIGGMFNLIALICFFYNTTLRSEVSNYFIFFMLAIPFIFAKQAPETVPKNVLKPLSETARKGRKIKIHS